MRLIDADELDKDVIRYADRKHFHGNIEEANIILKTRQVISAAPTIDAEPVRHGKWAHLGGDEWCCTACGDVIHTEGSWEKPTKKYCSECGAKMEGDEK